MSTTEPARKPARFVICPECSTAVLNTDEGRDTHIDFHEALDKRFDHLNGNLGAVRTTLGGEIDAIRADLRNTPPAASSDDSEDLVGEWPDTDETADAELAAVDATDPTVAPDDDLEDPTSDINTAVTVTPYNPNGALMNIHGA